VKDEAQKASFFKARCNKVVRFEVLTAVFLKIEVLWEVTQLYGEWYFLF
jgi:hypothetical protein